MKEKRLQIAIAVGLIMAAIALRLLPHPANFAPVTAVAIFGGAVLPRRLSVWVPLAVMIVSDAIIGFYNIMPITWACFALIALASSYWLRKPSFAKGFSLCIASSISFFAVTNFAVWLFGGIYSHTLSGLASCYTMALPFFRNTALSDLFYSGALIGAYWLALKATQKITKESAA